MKPIEQLKELWAAIYLAYLKWRMYRCYLAMCQIRDRADCGHQMLKEISPSYVRACQNLNAVLDKLAKADPLFAPKTRF